MCVHACAYVSAFPSVSPPLHCVSKKFPPLNSLQLCQILTDFQNFCTTGKLVKFATKNIQQYPSHLRDAATLPREIKNSNFLQIFSRYVKMQTKLHFQCTDFKFSTRVTVYAECIYVFLSSFLNTMLIVDKHSSGVCCDEFPVPQTDRKSKLVKEHSKTENFICNQYGKTRYLRHLKYQNLWMNIKVRSNKNAICLHLSISAKYLQKI